MTVLVVDDHAGLRNAVRRWVGQHENMEIVGEAVDGQDAIRQAADLRPDLIVMDVSMPVMDGISASRVIKKTNPETRILIFSSHNIRGLIQATKDIGLSGFVPKDQDGEGLMSALDAISHNKTYFPI